MPQQPSYDIREVWATNLEEEMDEIRHIVEKYPYVAMVRPFHFYHIFIVSDF